MTCEENTRTRRKKIYQYDNYGNLKSIYEYDLYEDEDGEEIFYGSTQFNYDSKNRLTGSGYEYDVIGNPTTYKGRSVTWKGKMLINYAGTAFTYDGKGRRKSKGDITFTYDCEGNLIKQSNGLEFFYDSQGVAGFVYNGKTYFYRKDAQGNVIAIKDSVGDSIVKYYYDAWGDYVIDGNSTIGVLNPFRYRSYYYDTETGLYYLQTRYYDPYNCRFLNMDSIDYADPSSIGGLNLYAYCNNDPVNNVDPTGRFVISALICYLALFLFTPVGGALAQVAVSCWGYIGMSIGAIFDGDIRSDMNLIGWNPFNSDENAVLSSNKVSFYKGMPVFRTNDKRSWTYYAIFLKRGDTAEGLKHERGHGWQSLMMGIGTYGLMIGLPSACEWSNRPYYDRPWEITADILGGANTPHNNQDVSRGWWYFVISNLFVPLGYLFLIGEY